jgi:DNA-binding GntR family transcriptional regulator
MAADSFQQPEGGIAGEVTLDRVTTVERIADGICELILRGEVEPGTQLREGELHASIGVSRNTVREALRLLERDGLVTYHAYRGVTVTTLSRADVTDLFRARIILETAAVDALRGGAELDHAAFEQARLAREEAVAKEDWQAAFDADIAFHAALVAAVQSRSLNDYFLALLRKLRLGFYIGGGLDTEGRERDTEQHRRISELLAEGDHDGARDAVREHLSDAESILRELIPADDGADQARRRAS